MSGEGTALHLIYNKYSISIEYLKDWFIKDSLSLLTNIIYYIHLNTDSAVRQSTQHATLGILNDILTSFDKGQFTCMLFIH